MKLCVRETRTAAESEECDGNMRSRSEVANEDLMLKALGDEHDGECEW